MQVNADFSQRVSAHAAGAEWIRSPTTGVERHMLDRLGGEVARATSIVRYAPGSTFHEHVHEGGEEILVLAGVLSDEHGDYGPGTYLRNPPGSRHSPRSTDGCLILVKLWQFIPDDDEPVEWFTKDDQFPIKVLHLFKHRMEAVHLERWAAGQEIVRAVPGGLELLVVEGGLEESGEEFAPLSWLRLPPGATLRARVGPTGCTVWTKSGHLDPPAGLRFFGT
jgi:anti-sigma factor ChrR (cupin superfamily)